MMDKMARQVDGADITWGKLCDDLVIKILAMLPIKSISRFKSVCKAWDALLNSPVFIRHHCDIASSSVEMTYMLALLVHVDIWRNKNNEIFALLLPHSCGRPVVTNMRFPLKRKVDHIQVVGSINGLVCLAVCKNFTTFVLWNPAIRKHSHIRSPQMVVRQGENVSVGFAYDQKRDNYKIVRILYFKDSYETTSPVAKVGEIYSTETDTWREIKIVDFPWILSMSNGVVVSGVPYWFSRRGDSSVEKLVWFDASTEAFEYYSLPPDDYSDANNMRLEVMGKHPVLMDCKYEQPLDPNSEECVTSAFIRKLIKADNGGMDSFHIEKLTVEPGPYLAGIVGFGRNGKIIAEGRNYSTLVLCDLEKNKHLSTKIKKKKNKHLASYDRGFAKVYYYNESLVWPSGLA